MDSLRWHGRGGMAEACLGRERVAVERTLVRCEGATKRRHVVRLVVTRTSCDVFDTLNQNRGRRRAGADGSLRSPRYCTAARVLQVLVSRPRGHGRGRRSTVNLQSALRREARAVHTYSYSLCENAARSPRTSLGAGKCGMATHRPFRSDAAAADARPRRLPRRASIIQECCRRADAQRFYLRPRAPAQPCAWRLEPRPTLGEQASRASLSLPVAFTPQGRARVRCCTNRARIGTNRRASTLVAPACARV